MLASGCGRIAFDPIDGSLAGSGVDAADAADAADASDGNADPSLLLHFTFESDGLLRDRGVGPDATCAACPSTAAGPRAGTNAANFDGVNDCLYVAAPTFHPTVLTYMAWIRLLDTRSETTFGSPYMGDTQVNDAFEIFQANPGQTEIQLNTQVGLGVATPNLEWHHVAGSFDGTDLTVYLDGGFIGTVQSAVPTYSTDAFMIGCDRDSGVEIAHFFGQIDDVRLYDRALSASEIAAIAL